MDKYNFPQPPQQQLPKHDSDKSSSDIVINPKESIKLIKGVKGNFSWEIKVQSESNIETHIKRLEQINNELKQKFGNKNN